jgi:hypothetical protein
MNDEIVGYKKSIIDFQNEYSNLVGLIDGYKSCVFNYKERIGKKEKFVEEYYKEQIKNMNDYFDDMIVSINIKKKEYNDIINKSLLDHRKIINGMKSMLVKKMDRLNKITNEKKVLDETYKAKIYEKFYITYNDIQKVMNIPDDIIIDDEKYISFGQPDSIDIYGSIKTISYFDTIERHKRKSNIFRDNMLENNETTKLNYKESMITRSSSIKESYKKSLSPKRIDTTKKKPPKIENTYIDKTTAGLIYFRGSSKQPKNKQIKSNKEIDSKLIKKKLSSKKKSTNELASNLSF